MSYEYTLLANNSFISVTQCGMMQNRKVHIAQYSTIPGQMLDDVQHSVSDLYSVL